MIVLLGSTSRQKANILHAALKLLSADEYDVYPCEVSSGIAEQPLDLETTLLGAANRAQNAAKFYAGDYDLSVGMEGGLGTVAGVYNLVCVVTLMDGKGNRATGKSRFLPLPPEVSKRIERGEEFGAAVRDYFTQRDLTTAEKILVEELIGRRESFTAAFFEAWMNLANIN